MDSEGANDWIWRWYDQACNKSDGPWLPIMDNCDEHESEIALPGLRIESFPLRTTVKYQSLDLGLIAHSKMRYRSLLRSIKIDVMLLKPADETEFPDSAQPRNV